MVELANNQMDYIKCRAELASPTTDWVTSWRRARSTGLGSEATSFLWKMLHCLLPTEARLSRILPNTSGNCKLCPTPVIADLSHCMFSCVSTREVGNWLLTLTRQHDSSLTPEKLLRLEFSSEQAAEMPIIWIVAQTLLYLWGVRSSGKTVSLITTRATLESKISLLRETRFVNEHTIIQELIEVNL